MKLFVLLLVALFLSACTTTSRPTISYVMPEITAADAQILASDMVAHLVNYLPPAKSTIVLDLPQSKYEKQPDLLTSSLINKLRKRGYGVVEVNASAPIQTAHGTIVRYLVSPLDRGIVLRIQYLSVEATRYYIHTSNGKLASSAPFIVRGNLQ